MYIIRIAIAPSRAGFGPTNELEVGEKLKSSGPIEHLLEPRSAHGMVDNEQIKGSRGFRGTPGYIGSQKYLIFTKG